WTSRCCARPRSCWARSRWWPAAPRAIAPPKSPWAAWIPLRCRPRRWNPSAYPACISSARCWM
ncbi:hypothetical protein SM139_1539, partial [Stenotrophomonas maltophilia]